MAQQQQQQQQIILVDQLVPKFQIIRRCNNYAMLQNISCSPECKIMRQLLLDHPLSYALTDVIQYRFTKLSIADLMKKFESIPSRLEEDYHSIKDDISLVGVYTTGNATVRGMRISNEFIIDDIRATKEDKEYMNVFVGDEDDDSGRIKPGSHKEHPEHVDDDDETEKEKKDDENNDDKANDDEKKDDTGSIETRNEKMQTPITSPTRSPRKNLSSIRLYCRN
nr:hypothetical protein [Tanacetum cinerariifolium]